MSFENKVNNRIIEKGGRLYRVGGCVRDSFLGIESKDIDYVVCGLDYEEILSILQLFGEPKLVGESFGVIKITVNGMEYDFAMPRTEVSTGDGHCDFLVKVDKNIPLIEELGRRDFTMNAIAYDVEDGLYVDPYNGITDIENKVIKCVGNPYDRFSEDPLRVFRAYQFSLRLGFNIELNTHFATIKFALNDKLRSISGERVLIELEKAFSKSIYDDNIEFCKLCSFSLNEYLSDIIIPETINKVYGNKVISNLVAIFINSNSYDKLKLPTRTIEIIKICQKLHNDQVDIFDVLYKKNHLADDVLNAMLSIGVYYGTPNILNPSELKLSSDEMIKMGIPNIKLGTIHKEVCRKIYEQSINNSEDEIYEYLINHHINN